MRVVTDQNTFISPIDRYGRIVNEQLLVIARSGYSKGLISSGIVEWYQRHGYLICILADPKHELECAFQMFFPEEKYHLDHLRLISQYVGKWKLPARHDVKIYHPFSFNIPTNRLLPEMNVFTIPIKSLGRAEWGLLSEVHGENETVSVLLKASEETDNEDGIYSFAHYVQDSVKGKSKKGSRKADWKNFGLEATSGTMKELMKVSNILRPFKKHFFLSKQNCEYNLDWKSILTDQKNYHVFVSNFIGRFEEKVTDFVVLYLLESILKNKQYLKCPILMVFPEIDKLCEFHPEGHKIFLSESIKKNLKTIRSEGKGMSSLGDTHSFQDLDEDVRGSSTIQLIGELGDIKDVENLCKALGYGKNIKEQLSKMEINRTYLVRGVEEGSIEDGGYLFFYPTAMHKEASYNFEEMYRKHNKENPEEYPLKSYKEMSDKMKAMFKEEENKIRKKVQKREKEIEELEKKKELEKASQLSASEETDKKIEKAKKIVDDSKEKIMQLVYEMFMDESLPKKEKSFRKIGIKFSIDKKTAQNYVENYKKKIQEEESKDFSDKVVEEMEDENLEE